MCKLCISYLKFVMEISRSAVLRLNKDCEAHPKISCPYLTNTILFKHRLGNIYAELTV